MRLSFLIYPFLLLIFISCTVKTPVVAVEKNSQPRFQRILDSIYMAHPDAIGIMAHIESPDKKISWSGSAGFSEKGGSMVIDPSSPALIASNTKTYVSATILRLVETGEIDLNEPIVDLISEESLKALKMEGYDPLAITVKHLLSHTSGIYDYTDADIFLMKTKEKAPYRWTRDEQIALAMSAGEPLGPPQMMFNYADTNYLLLTEIIESKTGMPFYTAMRKLLNIEDLGLTSTWFETLELKEKPTLPLVHQYATELGLHSYDIDVSFDLYGGGGIAASTSDLARFSQFLFSGRLFDDPNTLNLLYTEVGTKMKSSDTYYLGLSEYEVNGLEAFGHGGFWGTIVIYVPVLDSSIAVYVLERDQRALRMDILESLVKLL